ncbi:hypothetical protein CJI52_08965 [Bifidobacteriaceae bacterium WP022]|nr:hypothetical protein CJI52_08965 [Bifidobacteriaceae bacterium WP022]
MTETLHGESVTSHLSKNPPKPSKRRRDDMLERSIARAQAGSSRNLRICFHTVYFINTNHQY